MALMRRDGDDETCGVFWNIDGSMYWNVFAPCIPAKTFLTMQPTQEAMTKATGQRWAAVCLSNIWLGKTHEE